MVSRPRSRDGLEEEVIPGYLHGILFSIGRRGANGEFAGEQFIPGYGGAGPDENAIAGTVQEDEVMQPKILRPIRRKLDAAIGLDRDHLRSVHDMNYNRWGTNDASLARRSENGDWLRVFEVPVPVFGHGGRNHRLTDVSGRVIEELLA
jgi:hypothetical protein